MTDDDDDEDDHDHDYVQNYYHIDHYLVYHMHNMPVHYKPRIYHHIRKKLSLHKHRCLFGKILLWWPEWYLCINCKTLLRMKDIRATLDIYDDDDVLNDQ